MDESVSITLKISFAAGISAQDYKFLRFETSESVRSALQTICERANIVFSADFGLFLPPENSNMGGSWLHEDRTLSSYGLKNQSLVEFKPRPRTIKFLIDESQTLVPMVVEYSSTVHSVINQLCEQAKLKNPEEYVLQDASYVLDPSKSLRLQFGADQTGSLLLKKKAKLKDRKTRYKPFGVEGKPLNVFAPTMFGVPIQQAILYSGPRATLPSVVSKSIEWIELNALDIEGIFRLSGSSSEIDAYKEAFDRGVPFDFPENADPHAVAGLLKMYFRELPEPVIPFSMYSGFIQVQDIPSDQKEFKIKCFSSLISYLPHANRTLLQRLMGFLSLLVFHREKNKMGAPNLAIVFAQNLFRDQDGGVMSVVRDAAVLNSIAKIMIENYEHLFKTNPDNPLVGIVKESIASRAMGWVALDVGDFVFVTSVANGLCTGYRHGQLGIFPENAVNFLKHDLQSNLPGTPVHEKPILPDDNTPVARRARSISTKAHDSLDPSNDGPGLEVVEKQICALLESIEIKYKTELHLKHTIELEIESIRILLLQEAELRKQLEKEIEELRKSSVDVEC